MGGPLPGKKERWGRNLKENQKTMPRGKKWRGESDTNPSSKSKIAKRTGEGARFLKISLGNKKKRWDVKVRKKHGRSAYRPGPRKKRGDPVNTSNRV